MKKNVILILVSFLLLISLILGISYAYYIFNISQDGSNIVVSDCFRITFSDSNDINLINTVPISEEQAMDLVPYNFTIQNICNVNTNYDINVETINTSTIDLNAVRYKLDYRKSNLLGSVEDNAQSSIVNTNISSSKTIFSAVLRPDESKSFNFRLWVDLDSTIEQSADKTYSSKIVITSKYVPDYAEATLFDGQKMNKLMKELAGEENPTINTQNTNIKAFKKANTMNYDSEFITVSEAGYDKIAYMWFEDGTIYIYSKNNKLYFNDNSSKFFYNLEGIEEIDVSFLDSSRVTKMGDMFGNLSVIETLDLSTFDTSSVTSMYGLFHQNKKLKNLDISSFDTSNVTNMSDMFVEDDELIEIDVSNFDTSNVTNMEDMFYYNKKLKTIKLGKNFKTSKVTTFEKMFYSNELVEELDVSDFDTSSATNMADMFSGMKGLKKLDVSGFDTSKVTRMDYMFFNCQSVDELNIKNFNTTNVANMTAMFDGLSSIKELEFGENFKTSKIKSMYSMFRDMPLITTLDLSTFDTSLVTSFRSTFSGDTSLTTIIVGPNWNTSAATTTDNTFKNCTSLIGGEGTAYNASHIDASYAHVDGGTSNPGYFTLKTN